MTYPLSQDWQPVASTQLTPQLILARWLVLCYDRPGTEGNTLLDEALPGSPELVTTCNWPLAADIDDVLDKLVAAGWIERMHFCPDLTQARHHMPGAPKNPASGYYYRPCSGNSDYSEFVDKWRHKIPGSYNHMVGKRVRLTASFLMSTGQNGRGDAKKVWTVVSCSCSSCDRGETLAVNERRDGKEALADYAVDPEYVEYLRKHPYRHVNERNVRVVR